MRLSFSIFAAAFIAAVSASNVIELKPDNWDAHVGIGKPGLVEFFAPWCGHCKNLAPVYEQLADAYTHASDKVYIAKVDADGEGKPLGQKYGVTGFPTLKWFSADGTAEPYDGGRDLDSLVAFVTKMSGVKSSIKPPAPPAYEILDVHTFDEVVQDPAKNVLVSFTAPWCGHCKTLKPTYDKVAKIFESEPNCVVANIDADDQKNKDIAARYNVNGYPTLKFFSATNKDEPEDYEGGRSEADFVEFLNEKCGTQRAVGGGLNTEAGRVAEFDVIAQKFFAAADDARAAVWDEAKALVVEGKEASKYYLRVMEKIVTGGVGYLEKEGKRLESILKKRNLAPAKLDEIQIKANILKAFAKVEEEKVEEKVGSGSEEL